MSTPYVPGTPSERSTGTASNFDAASERVGTPGPDDTAAYSDPSLGRPSLDKQDPIGRDKAPDDRPAAGSPTYSSASAEPSSYSSASSEPSSYGSPAYEPPSYGSPAYDSPSYSTAADETQEVRPSAADRSRYSDDPAVTSVYPQQQPNYAPAGYPAAYAPATVVPPPSGGIVPEKPRSRVGPGFLGALIGLLCCAGGVYLLARFGFSAGRSLSSGRVDIGYSVLAALGAALLLVAVLLDGWSPWSTLLPGIALTALGGWSLFDAGAVPRVGSWTRSVLSQNQLSVWSLSGLTLGLGVALLGASVAAMLARASGKRDGRILGRRDAALERSADR